MFFLFIFINTTYIIRFSIYLLFLHILLSFRIRCSEGFLYLNQAMITSLQTVPNSLFTNNPTIRCYIARCIMNDIQRPTKMLLYYQFVHLKPKGMKI
jgi:hypothetical protein